MLEETGINLKGATSVSEHEKHYEMWGREIVTWQTVLME